MSNALITQTFDSKLSKLPSIEYISELVNKTLSSFKLRKEYVKYSYPILSHETLTGIRENIDKLGITKVIELSCGTGWLTHWLRKYGVNVIKCVDNFTWRRFKGNILPIVEEQDSIECVKQNPDTELFILSWPYMDSVAFYVFRAMKKGRYLLYIGEDEGGCTADYNFFNLVKMYEEVDVNIPLARFFGIYDSIYLFRKEKSK